MPEERISPRAVIFVVAVFLALVLVLLRWSADVEDTVERDQSGPLLSGIQVTEDGKLVEIDTLTLLANGEPGELVEESINLLLNGTLSERRTTAIQLSYMTNDPSTHASLLGLGAAMQAKLRNALLEGLNDTDVAVAKNCRTALIGWWRMSESPAATQQFQQGLAAYEARQWDVAMETFEGLEALGGPVPSDLHRMKAEIYLTKSRFKSALGACGRALQAEPKHFVALYVAAQAYAMDGRPEEALQALEHALAIYRAFPEALKLQAELKAAGGTVPAVHSSP